MLHVIVKTKAYGASSHPAITLVTDIKKCVSQILAKFCVLVFNCILIARLSTNLMEVTV